MRRVAILFSHLGSGSDVVFDALSEHPRIDGFRTGSTYDHYDKIVELTAHSHKNENASAVWLDEVLYNHQFTCKPLLAYIRPIFVLREPRGSIAEILRKHPEYDAQRAADYYRYRISGLCEYAHRSPEPFVVAYDEMALDGIERFLGVKEAVVRPTPIAAGAADIPLKIIEECESCYELHLGHLKRAGRWSCGDQHQRR